MAAYWQGYRACCEGFDHSANPYVIGDHRYMLWRKGMDQAMADHGTDEPVAVAA